MNCQPSPLWVQHIDCGHQRPLSRNRVACCASEKIPKPRRVGAKARRCTAYRAEARYLQKFSLPLGPQLKIRKTVKGAHEPSRPTDRPLLMVLPFAENIAEELQKFRLSSINCPAVCFNLNRLLTPTPETAPCRKMFPLPDIVREPPGYTKRLRSFKVFCQAPTMIVSDCPAP